MAKSKNAVNGVYCFIINNEVVYVGSGHDIKNSRKSNHLSLLKNNEHGNWKLQQLYNEIGNHNVFKDGFTVLEECLVKNLKKRENYYKNLYKDTVLNINEIDTTKKKSIKTGLKAKRHKEMCRDLQSGENNPRCITPTDTIIKIKCCIRDGMTNGEIAKLFGKRKDYIAQIRGDFKWKSVSIPIGYGFQPEHKIELPLLQIEIIPQENILAEVIIPQETVVETVQTI